MEEVAEIEFGLGSVVGQEGVTKNMYQMINRSALGHSAPGKLVDEAVLDRVQSWQLGRPEGRNGGRGG